MRKRRRLANKMTIMVCAVLIAVSTFFYAPVEVSAEEVVLLSADSGEENATLMSVDEYVEISGDVPNVSGQQLYYRYIDVALGSFDLKDYFDLDDNILYQVDVTMFGSYQTNAPRVFSYPGIYVLSNSVRYLPLDRMNVDGSGDVISKSASFTLMFYGSDSEFDLRFYSSLYSPDVTSLGIQLGASFDFSNLNVVSSSNSDDYQNGFNAGYSAGESAGYGNGYSQGFTDGEASVDTDAIYDEAYQAGIDSVDTQSYYDAGYQAGYQVAYSEGYESGYDVGYQDAMDRIANWGADTSNYPLLIEQTDGTFDLQFDFIQPARVDDVISDYCDIGRYYSGIDFNPNHTYRLDFTYHDFEYDYSDSYFTASYSFWLYWGSCSFPITVGTKDDITSSFYISGDQIGTGLKFRCDVSGLEAYSEYFGVLHYYINDCTLKLYDMGPCGDTQNHIANQTDQLTNGYDDSKGNQVNSELSTGLNEFETAENSLFATATTGMRDFTFFDFESVPAMITGMSFIGSIMGSWFNQAGGASGVGIVLSILFSVILVAMVLGLYRWYQSRGGKN